MRRRDAGTALENLGPRGGHQLCSRQLPRHDDRVPELHHAILDDDQLHGKAAQSQPTLVQQGPPG